MSETEFHLPPYPCAVNDSHERMMTTERDQRVIVVPEAMRLDPLDTAWLNESNAIRCGIYTLGEPLGSLLWDASNAEYLVLLLKLITGGVAVIHHDALDATNAKYLEVYPDAEGSRGRGTRLPNIWDAPFEIVVPANTSCTKDAPWPPEGKEVIAHLNPMHDRGQVWGLGLALRWPDGQYVQINARTDGRWGIRRNGQEYQCGECPAGKPLVVAIVLDHKRIQLNCYVGRHEYVAEFPRIEFPRVPSTVRVGKIGPTWDPQQAEDIGSIHPCRVEWVRFYVKSVFREALI